MASIQPGSVYYFSEESFSSTEPHFSIVLNHSPTDDGMRLSVCPSSRPDSVKGRRKYQPIETLVEIRMGDYLDSTSDSIVDCNTIIEKTIGELAVKLSRNLRNASGAIPLIPRLLTAPLLTADLFSVQEGMRARAGMAPKITIEGARGVVYFMGGRMRNFSVTGAVLFVLLTCSPAMSADVGRGTYNWTGFYVGLNVGGAVNASSYTLSPAGSFLKPADSLHDPACNPLRSDSGDIQSGAFTGGGQVGYNYQSGRLVFGLETDFQYNGVDESRFVARALAPPLFGPFIHSVTQEVDFFGTFRGRLGFTPADRLMVFGTGGFAWGDISSRSSIAFSGGDHYLGSSSGIRTGWAAGAGAEYALSRCLTVKFEYLYIDLGSNSYTYGQQNPEFAGYTYTTQLDTAEHVMRLGINYRFH